MRIPGIIEVVAVALLVSLTIYALSGGADYGGGVLDLLARGPRADRQRRLIGAAIGPIWEADHVWLVLVVVIMFTAFPPAFARITTWLHIPLTLMLVGVVLRGSAFTFRSYGYSDREERRWGRVFAFASLVTPVLLGVILGAVASGRIVGQPGQFSDFVTPWLAPFPIAVGIFALALFTFLAAVYLTIESGHEHDLQRDFRNRALAASVATGVMAALVLLLSISGAPAIWRGLTERPWTWPLFWATALAGFGGMWALWTERYDFARLCAIAEVTLFLWGWAFAQFPMLVEPDMTIYSVAAPRETLRLLVGALMIGGLLLFPSFRYLLRVFKGSRAARRGRAIG